VPLKSQYPALSFLDVQFVHHLFIIVKYVRAVDSRVNVNQPAVPAFDHRPVNAIAQVGAL
jgi:hypothetical protein